MPKKTDRDNNIIYLVRNTVTGKVYIGKSGLKAEQRFWRHCNNATVRGLKGKLYNSIRKHGVAVFTVELVATVSVSMVDYVEQLYIMLHNSAVDGYNLTNGGDGGPVRLGQKNTESQKKAVSIANKGRKWTPEQRIVLMAARMRQADERRGVPRPEAATWLSKRKGSKRSPESIERMRAAKLRQWAAKRALSA